MAFEFLLCVDFLFSSNRNCFELISLIYMFHFTFTFYLCYLLINLLFRESILQLFFHLIKIISPKLKFKAHKLTHLYKKYVN